MVFQTQVLTARAVGKTLVTDEVTEEQFFYWIQAMDLLKIALMYLTPV